MMKNEFKIEEYDPSWVDKYEEEMVKLKQVFGSNLHSIHHIGSTAIRNTMAKPEIDILIVVKDVLRLSESDEDIVKLGYVVRGQCLDSGGVSGRFYYSKDVNRVRTHKVHVCQVGHPEIMDKLLFVKYLNDHKEVAETYSKLKVQLSGKYNYGKEFSSYLDGKSRFIMDVLSKSKKENSHVGYHDFICTQG